MMTVPMTSETNSFLSLKSLCVRKKVKLLIDYMVPTQTQPPLTEMFIEGFHALYHVQIGELKVAALFDTGTSINAIFFKFFRSIYHQLKIIPTNRKVVLADGDSLGPVGEVHLKFQLGKVVFHDRFIILVNLKQDIILGLPWQSNYKIGCDWNREGKHFISIKGQFLAHSINQHVIQQLAKTKGQCKIQHRSMTWITVKMPKNLNNNSIYEIEFDRKLPSGIIPLDVTHNLNHKQPGKLLIPLLNVTNKDVKLPKNTILGSINQINDVDSIQEVSWKKIQDAKNEAVSNATIMLQDTDMVDPQTHKLLPDFPNLLDMDLPNFQIHIPFKYKSNDKIASQPSCYK